MRIGLFTDQYYPSISGVVTSVKMLYEGLTNLGHECFIFTSFDEKQVTNPDELNSKNVINIYGRPYPFKDLRDYRYTLTHRRFLKLVRQYNLDIIHVHTEYNISKLANLAHKKLHIPMVHTLHTLWGDYFKYVSPFCDKHFHKIMEKMLRKLFTGPVAKNSTIEIVPTRKVYEQSQKYGLGKDIRIIPTGIELERFYASNFSKDEISSLKKDLGIGPEQFVFLYIGRTSKEKNIEVLLNAYAKACRGNEKTVFLLVGGGPELEELKADVAELNIEKQVVFAGTIPWDKIPLYYQLGDVFLNASQSETQGLTYIEALGSSLPLLVQKDECIAEVVEDYFNGIYFDGEEELAVKMKEVLANPEILKGIKENTLKSVENYSKEKFSENILAVYEEAVEKYKKPKNRVEK